MRRRTFFKSLGVAGLLPLADILARNTPAIAANPHCEAKGLRGPFSLAFAPSGNLFVTDSPGYCVVELDVSLKPVSCFGGPGAVPGRLNFPMGLAVDASGLIYVVDSNNGRVQVFDDRGKVRRVIGSIGCIGGSFATPQGVHVTADGRVLVADTRNHRVHIYRGEKMIAVLGDLGDEKEQFRLPSACAVGPGGEIFVLDGKHAMVKVFGEDLKFRRAFGGDGDEPGKLNMPQGMAFDERGNLWIADTKNHRLQEFTAEGKLLTVTGKHGSGPGEFDSPTGIAFRKDEIFVADRGNGRIQALRRGRSA
jgi:DNA-binding beta-propeller fold protein YncE